MLIGMSVHSEPLISGGADLHTHPKSPLQTSCPASRGPIISLDPITANMVLTELPVNQATPRDGAGDIAPRGGDGPLQIKNGLQSQAETPQQPQKLNKRRYSMNVGFKHPGLSKRRRRANSECDPVLPSNFLLGGNIFDPLNLNSLLDEEVNKALNAETPKSSPLPAKNRDPVEILIPKDITDPLNLNGRGGDTGAGVLVSPLKNRRRHRNRHHGAAAAGASGQYEYSESEKSKGNEGSISGPLFPLASSSGPESGSAADAPVKGAVLLGFQAVEGSPRPYELNTSINCRDEVVPPILPRKQSQSLSNSAPPTQCKTVGSASSAQTAKHRKRRRTNSRSDRLSITPTPPTRQLSAEKTHSQTFHTPIVGGVTGSHSFGVQKIPQQQRRSQRKFQYGNYSRYYGYRTPVLSADPRLAVFRPDWFRGKKVLDVGCNTGHMTIAIARYWKPSHILGLDIDGMLIHAARQNLRHFLSELHRQEVFWSPNTTQEKKNGNQKRRTDEDKASAEQPREKPDAAGADGSCRSADGAGEAGLTPLMRLRVGPVPALTRFPLSFTRCRGPIATPPLLPHTPGAFPSNITFLKGNYVLDRDEAVMSQSEQYDVILCLSLTKWVHLNFGDSGIQRLFHRIYRHLLPGGVLILEPQPWSSYSRRKRLTDVTHRNYNSIRLKPDQFSTYLTSDVGFSSYELIGTPQSSLKGFQRPIYLFHKGPASNRR